LPITFDDVFNPKIPSEANSFQTAPITISNDMFKSLAKKVVIYYVLQYYLLAYLKFIRWKHDQLIARGVATMQMNPRNTSFPEMSGDNFLKRHHNFLEFPLAKKKIHRNT
jgi:hypothetical protein